MTALTKQRVTGLWKSMRTLDALVAGSVKIFKGANCGFKAGYLVPWVDSDPEIKHPCIAIPDREYVDNTAGANGAVSCPVDFGHEKLLYPFANDNVAAVAQANIGGDAWGKDDQTVSATGTDRSRVGTPWLVIASGNTMGYRAGVYVELDKPGVPSADSALLEAELASTDPEEGASKIGVEDAGALFAADNVEDVLQEMGVLVAAGMTAQKRTVTVGHADLTDADGSQAINIGAALPANSRIIGVDMRSLTPFTGGGAGAVTVDVGTSGDVDALIDGADVFAAAVDGGPAIMPAGVRPNKAFAAGGQLIATFDADVDVADLTAGSVVIDVLFIVLE